MEQSHGKCVSKKMEKKEEQKKKKKNRSIKLILVFLKDGGGVLMLLVDHGPVGRRPHPQVERELLGRRQEPVRPRGIDRVVDLLPRQLLAAHRILPRQDVERPHQLAHVDDLGNFPSIIVSWAALEGRGGVAVVTYQGVFGHVLAGTDPSAGAEGVGPAHPVWDFALRSPTELVVCESLGAELLGRVVALGVLVDRPEKQSGSRRSSGGVGHNYQVFAMNVVPFRKWYSPYMSSEAVQLSGSSYRGHPYLE